MKKSTSVIFAFLFAVVFYCCKNFQEHHSSPYQPSVENSSPLADDGHAEGNVPVTSKETPSQQNAATTHQPVAYSGQSSSSLQQNNSVSSAKELKKDLKKIARKNNGGDGDSTGIAIGLLILIILLSIAVLILLIWLIAAATSNAASQGSSNSGSNSNSGNGGNGGGSSGNGGSGSGSGCYIATMVYGDYDAPQVMVLRKFRDEKLSHSKAGRAFINWYYSWSPRFVEKYSHLKFVHRFAKFFLDRFVNLLSK